MCVCCAVNLVFGFQPQPAQNPRADVQQFVSSFEVQYGLQHPPFLVASYQQVNRTFAECVVTHYAIVL